MSELNGVLPADKPAGPTSHDIVAIARRALKVRRIGHTGTLDPFATGLLLLCVGPATRLSEYLTALPKTYTATLRLGESTDTDDSEGAVIRSSDEWRSLTFEDVAGSLDRQRGDILQVPPRYSAKRIAGERMYAVARRGEEVVLDAIPVRVEGIRITRFELPEVEIEVECSSGTYIRSIGRDVGEALGVGAHLTALRRTRIGIHSVDGALTLAELEDPGAVARAMISPVDALAHLARAVIAEPERATIARGGSITLPEGWTAAGPIVLSLPEGELVAIGEARDGRLHPRKVFV